MPFEAGTARVYHSRCGFLMNNTENFTGPFLRRPLRLGRAVRLVWESAPRWTAAGLGLIVIQGLVPLGVLYATRQIVDGVAAGIAATGKAEAFHQVLFWVAAAVALALVSIFCRSLSELIEEGQSLAVTDAVSDRLHSQSVAVDLAYYENPLYFDTLHQAQAEAPYRPTRIVNGLIMLFQNGISVAGIVALLFSYNWWLALVMFLVAVPGLLVRVVFSHKFYGLRQGQIEAERKAWYYSDVLTGASHAKELRLFNYGGLFREKFRLIRRDLRKNILSLSRRRSLMEFLAQAAAAASIFIPFAYIAWQAITGSITLGGLVMYFQGFHAGLGFIQSFFQGLAALYEDNLFLEHYYRFLEIKPAVISPPDPQPVPDPGKGGLRFEHVYFAYPGCPGMVLEDINLNIAPGQVIALVGGNGSGKTTLVKLLCRLYDPDEGRITAGGVDLRRLDPVQWRREISVIFQDYLHYHLKAWENIWLGDTERAPDLERVAAAARFSGADSAIRALPRGYENILGRMFQDGNELSAGEWQKVALARVFMRAARIMVMDEPASSLDPLAEERVFRDFRRLVEGRSAVLVSHRFTAVQMADCIYVLDKGRIVEEGAHRDLLARGGLYARLFNAQAAPCRG